MNCEELSKCMEAAFRLKRQREEELAGEKEQSLSRVWARVQKRLKDGDLPEEPDVDCQMVRPFLPLAVDPLGLVDMPAWLEEHLVICQDCRGELGDLERLKHIIIVAEMAVLMEEVIADAPPEFMEEVHKLRAISPEEITCEQARLCYHNVAICNLEVPAEIYRHIRHCPSCKEQVRRLRSDLAVGIPEVGTPEFERLLGGKGGLRLVAGAKPPHYVADQVGTFVHRNWRKLTGAAAAAIIIGFLIISPGQAIAVTFEQVCAAFAKMQFIHIRTTQARTEFIQTTAPREEIWYTREPLGKITRHRDGTYTRFTEADGTFVEYGPEGELQFRERYSGRKLQKIVKTFQRDLDFRQNLGLSKFAEVRWSLLHQGVNVNGTSTDVYEL